MKRMKKSVFISLLLVVSAGITAQESCKVLVEALQGTYEGDCKGGLAEGQGKAVGTDNYEGEFKKGYPHGKGTYTWTTGEVYTGKWKKGTRSGVGEYRFAEGGKAMVQNGIWKKDEYVGPVIEKPAVMRQQNISRYQFQRVSDGNELYVYFYKGGTEAREQRIDMETYSSGTAFYRTYEKGYELIEFPFTCRFTYKTTNQINTATMDCVIEFTIKQPGKWRLNIYNL